MSVKLKPRVTASIDLVEIQIREILDQIDTDVIAEHYDHDDLLESIGKESILSWCELQGWLQ